MAEESNATSTDLRVEVTPDKLRAFLHFIPKEGQEPPLKEDVVVFLQEQGIALTDDVRARVDPFVAAVAGKQPLPEPHLIAEGTPAYDGQSEEFIRDPGLDQQAQEWQGDAAVSHYSFNHIVTVDEGDLIGTLKPFEPSRDGSDVFGNRIAPRGRPKKLSIHETIEQTDDDPCKLISRVAGKIAAEPSGVRINEILYIAGDVDFSCGNLDATTDVDVKGNVQDRFEVKSVGTITVGGAIEAAMVEAAKDILVRGSIIGRNSGHVRAGGDLIARFAQEATISSDGDMRVIKGLMSCHAETESRFMGENASIIGGVLWAGGNAEVATVGSEANVPTRVFLGVHPDELTDGIVSSHIADGEKSVDPTAEAVDRIRGMLQPLLARYKSLSPDQKKTVTTLMEKVELAEKRLAGKRKKKGRGKHPPGAKLRVAKMIYPGVKVSINTRVTSFTREYKGPVAIEERKIENVTEMVMVNQLSASVQILKSGRVPAEELRQEFASCKIG